MQMAYIPPALLAKYDATGPRDSRFPALTDWQGGIDHTHYHQALANRDARNRALYAHFPFCMSRCACCACTAMACGQPETVDEYIARLEAELRLLAVASGTAPAGRALHWCGGTPNFLRDGQLVRAFDVIATHCALASDLDCTIEADPRLVTTTQLRWLRGVGFQRISFGVQDLTPDVQHTIGRVQSTALITDVVDIARQQGFGSVNLDLVYGLPNQTAERSGDTVDATIKLAPDRVACFAYCHMPWSHPNQQRMDVTGLPSGAERFLLHQLAVERFTDAGHV